MLCVSCSTPRVREQQPMVMKDVMFGGRPALLCLFQDHSGVEAVVKITTTTEDTETGATVRGPFTVLDAAGYPYGTGAGDFMRGAPPHNVHWHARRVNSAVPMETQGERYFAGVGRGIMRGGRGPGVGRSSGTEPRGDLGVGRRLGGKLRGGLG